jgi:pre-rRNA-processing protein TSR3
MLFEVIIDAGETPNKCTIAPLSYRSDFTLFHVKGSNPLGPLKSSILLHHEGQCLSELRQSPRNFQGIASIDCVWRRLETLLHRIANPIPCLARIPEGFETAYPRRSKKNTDPTQGLATIEAIFIASALLGNWDPSLLSEYYFGRRFIELNQERFLAFGIKQAADPTAQPVLTPRSRDTMQRRRDRGKTIRKITR